MTVRRIKTYTGSQGYVYQYYFVGKRPVSRNGSGAGTEYIFDVSADRKTTYSVSICLETAVVEQWVQAHGRDLNDAEQYGAVKMRLFHAFDEIENMLAEGRNLLVDHNALEQLLAELGVD